jgi:predicted O-methyltransferase YrrM
VEDDFEPLPVVYPGLAGQSWMCQSELSWLIERLPAEGIFLEVGTASGVSAARIAMARPKLRILCVDPFPDHDEDRVRRRDGSRIDNWRRNAQPNMNLFVGTLRDLEDVLGARDFDAILVDGDHEEEGCFDDLMRASSLVDRRGVVFAHDVGCRDWPGVDRAVERAKQAFGYSAIARHRSLEAMVIS